MNLKRSASENDWAKVLEATEEAMTMPCAATWLDLQRFAVTALEQVGISDAARVVRRSLRTLLEVLPDLLDLTLPDDTPAANAETRTWIAAYVLPPKAAPKQESTGDLTSSSDESSSYETSSFDTSSLEETPQEDLSSALNFDETSTSTDTESAETQPEQVEAGPFNVEDNPPILDSEQIAPTESAPATELDAALAVVRDGRTAEGLAQITGMLATERSGRGRFKRRTQLAHLLMAAGRQKVALPLLHQLAEEIESRRLEEWEQSEALAYPLELLWRCLNSDDEAKKRQLYDRLCRLDPVRAVNCTG
jgi:type VI secretion system protein ImpA